MACRGIHKGDIVRVPKPNGLFSIGRVRQIKRGQVEIEWSDRSPTYYAPSAVELAYLRGEAVFPFDEAVQALRLAERKMPGPRHWAYRLAYAIEGYEDAQKLQKLRRPVA